MTYLIILLCIILLLVLYAIWSGKRLIALNISIYRTSIQKLQQDYVSKLGNIENKILKEVSKNQKIQEKLTEVITDLSRDIKTIKEGQVKDSDEINKKLNDFENSLVEMYKLMNKVNSK